jgi:hypothetical protein
VNNALAGICVRLGVLGLRSRILTREGVANVREIPTNARPLRLRGLWRRLRRWRFVNNDAAKLVALVIVFNYDPAKFITLHGLRPRFPVVALM